LAKGKNRKEWIKKSVAETSAEREAKFKGSKLKLVLDTIKLKWLQHKKTVKKIYSKFVKINHRSLGLTTMTIKLEKQQKRKNLLPEKARDDGQLQKSAGAIESSRE
jgi:hypothetical protein